MIVESLALFTAFCYAVSSVLVRKGLADSSSTAASLYTAVIQVALLSVILLPKLPEIKWSAVIWFAASGIFASGLGRLYNYRSVEHLGVAMSSALIGISPMLTAILAFLFLGEVITLPLLLGVIMVVGGIFTISYRGRDGKINPKVMLYPFLAALFYASSGIVRKVGLNIQPNSLLGAQIGASAGLLSYLAYLAASGNLGNLKASSKSFTYFSGAGVSNTLAWLAMYQAIALGDVSVVSTLVGAYPLFGLLLSYLTLRGSEIIDRKVIAGSILIVAGVAVVTLF